jgi:flavorubredoxin
MISMEDVNGIIHKAASNILSELPVKACTPQHRVIVQNELLRMLTDYMLLELADEKDRVAKLQGRI